jgi:hypothetical protein
LVGAVVAAVDAAGAELPAAVGAPDAGAAAVAEVFAGSAVVLPLLLHAARDRAAAAVRVVTIIRVRMTSPCQSDHRKPRPVTML